MTVSTLERSTEIAKELQKGKMQSQAYSKGPLGAGIMTLRVGDVRVPSVGITQGIRLWTGNADFDITDINPKHRQAVVAVDEAKRSVTRSYQIDFLRTVTLDIPRSDIQRRAQRNFPVVVPGRPKFKLDDFEAVGTGDIGGRSQRFRVTGTMTMPATALTLLLGMDETSHFISALPERVATVKDAHEVLRPESVPERTPRQGEWFFVPATDEEVDRLVAHLDGRTRKATVMETGSTHSGFVIPVPDVGRFAIGTIRDRREGRHASLFLKTWHKVVRNTEVVLPNQVRTTRYWD